MGSKHSRKCLPPAYQFCLTFQGSAANDTQPCPTLRQSKSNARGRLGHHNPVIHWSKCIESRCRSHASRNCSRGRLVKHIVIGFLLLGSSLGAQSTVPDRTVMGAYVKAAELMKISQLGDAAIAVEGTNVDGKGARARVDAAALNLRLKQEEISFSFSNWKSGPIAQINSKKWGDVLSIPLATEKTLKVDIHPMDYSDFELAPVRWLIADASWTDPVIMSAHAVDLVTNMPVQGVLALGSAYLTDYTDVVFTRYTSYEISYAYKGKTVGPYSALFLYGSRPNGQSVISPQDAYFDHQALYTTITQQLEPFGFTRTHLREIPEVRKYLTDHQVSSDECVTGKGQLCCDGNTCGLAGPDLANSLAQPLIRKTTPQQ
jgi:hypothetical protein